jgi:ABC-type transport system substrate-binding protein
MRASQASHADGAACDGYEDAACNTLTLTLSRPAPYFHTVMSLWVTFPAKEENITEGGEQWWNSSKYQVGNGPYVLRSLEPFVRATFAPNPNYWAGVGNVNFEYSYITDSAVSFEAYKGNEFDIIGLAAEDLEVVRPTPAEPGSQHLSRLLHLRRHVPSAEGTLHRSEGARGLCVRARPRDLGAGRAAGPWLADPDLDPARVPWVRRG